MTKKANHIVLTTIHSPEVLTAYLKNIKANSRLDSVKVWIVGDKKTPNSVSGYAKLLSSRGLETEYLGISKQIKWGKSHKEFFNKLPFNNETRRNIGYLHALAEGCERLISIDDDNWPLEDDFIGGHEITGKDWRKQLLKSESGYYDVSKKLTFQPDRKIFLRGYPFSLRNKKTRAKSIKANQKTVVGVNLGLWLRDPDIDAITWLNGSIRSTGFAGRSSEALNNDTWTPINTQNTSVVRELVPAFFCIPMGYQFPGGPLERYGDVWAGYFLQSLIRGLDYVVTVGRPVVEHKRNPHDYLEDLRKEYWGMILTDWIVEVLKSEFRPKEKQITNRVRELSEFISANLLKFVPKWSPKETTKFLAETAKIMRLWVDVCDEYL